MSRRSALGQAARQIKLEAQRRAAPREHEEREVPTHSPAIPITEAYIEEWLANDEELAQLRFERQHGVLY